MRYSFSHNDVPPSFNQAGSRGGRMVFHRTKKIWQEIFELNLMATLPRKQYKSIVVSASLRFDTNRRRDEGNYRSIIEKAMGDALVNGGWLKDDTSQEFIFQHVFFEASLGPKRTTVHLLVEE